MKTKNQKKLIVIGCGPKGTAIGVKAKVLEQLGYDVPEVIIIEKSNVGAHWDGKHGLTHGKLQLGSPPQKDIGFPYRSLFHKKVDVEMQKYSWNAYLVDTDYYVDWIDRGRLAPTHSEWAKYFQWTIQKSGVQVYQGEVTKIKKSDSQWHIEYTHKDKKHFITGDGLVVTGPGEANQLPIKGKIKKKKNIPTVLNGHNFWHYAREFRDVKYARFAIVGGGEAAASIIVSLLESVDLSSVKIDILNGHATVYTRSESSIDNVYFSDPTDWLLLSEQERKRFIDAARAGNFSIWAKDIIAAHYLDSWVSHKTVNMKIGRGKEIEITPNGKKPFLIVSTLKGEEKIVYDYIICAMGFNRLSFTNLMDSNLDLHTVDTVERKITQDMSVENLAPKLHLPMLSALTQGIGFSELTCLGLTADRILYPYVNKHQQIHENNNNHKIKTVQKYKYI